MVATTFRRDTYTWLAYFMLGFFAYLQGLLGPIMPFIREELELNYTVAGFHFSAFAIGMSLTGFTGSWAIEQWGRTRLFWGGGLGMALASIGITVAQTPLLTILCAFLMGWLGSFLLIVIQATLSDHHENNRAIALTESNIFASIFATFAPAMIGVGIALTIGWQFAVMIMVIVWIASYLTYRSTQIPNGKKQKKKKEAEPPVPRAFWAYWMVIFLVTCCEWCVIFWGADFLQGTVGLPKETAATTMTIFFFAMIIGRVIGSYITRFVPSRVLLLFSILIVIMGFIPFWLAQETTSNIVGLFITGIGVANMFPMGLATASAIAADSPNFASARISMAAGTAIFLAPQILAGLADQIGIQWAFGIVLVLAVIALLITRITVRLT